MPLAGGPPPTATSAPFTPTAPGAYRWIAAYSGDANYPAVTSLCNDANETSVVAQAVADIVTQATPVVTIGSPISDVATVTGAAAPAPLPTGTVTFTLFGPGDPTCANPAIFTSANRPLTGPPPAPPAVQATSDPFTPTAVGTYNWVAVYSGDANYPSVTSPCGAPNEASVVNPGDVSIITAGLRAGHARQPDQRHRHRHRRRRPRADTHRHRHLHPVRPRQPHLHRGADLHQRQPTAGRRTAAHRPVGGLHAHGGRHVPVGRRLQR